MYIFSTDHRHLAQEVVDKVNLPAIGDFCLLLTGDLFNDAMPRLYNFGDWADSIAIKIEKGNVLSDSLIPPMQEVIDKAKSEFPHIKIGDTCLFVLDWDVAPRIKYCGSDQLKEDKFFPLYRVCYISDTDLYSPFRQLNFLD